MKRLAARGIEVEVLASAYRGGGNKAYLGIPVHRFRYFPARWEDLTHDETVPDRIGRGLRYRLAAICYVLAGMFAAWRLCRQKGYDIIHVHWPMPHALFGWAARRASGSRLVTTFYGVELRWTRSRLGPLQWILKRAARRSDRVIAISRHTAAEVKRLADVEAEVIPYPPAIEIPVSAASPALADSAAAPAPFTILFVGRLVERKGVAVLIDAIARLVPEHNLRLVVVGEGPERPRLEARVRELGLSGVIQFRGRISPGDLGTAYREARLCVLPAVVDHRGDTEGLGVVLLEAMSHGVPVIGSDVGGITDIIEHEKTGLLVPPSDAGDLAQAIARVIEEPDLVRRLGEAGQREVAERFGWEAITQRWESVYRAVLSGAPR